MKSRHKVKPNLMNKNGGNLKMNNPPVPTSLLIPFRLQNLPSDCAQPFSQIKEKCKSSEAEKKITKKM